MRYNKYDQDYLKGQDSQVITNQVRTKGAKPPGLTGHTSASRRSDHNDLLFARALESSPAWLFFINFIHHIVR